MDCGRMPWLCRLCRLRFRPWGVTSRQLIKRGWEATPVEVMKGRPSGPAQVWDEVAGGSMIGWLTST